MGVFSSIVRSQALIMDRSKPFFADGDGIGLELVRGDALWRKALLLQQLSQQSPRRSSTASALDQEVEHLPFIIDSPPQPVFSTTNLEDHLVEVPACTWPRPATATIASNQQPELQKPAPDGLVRNVNAPLCQQFLDIAKRQREPGVEPNRVLDDHRWKAMPLERYRGHSATVATPDRADQSLNVSMP